MLRLLILIEAKAYGAFDGKQLDSKLRRLNRLHDFYQGLEEESPRRVCFHLLLLSPERPKVAVSWPTWGRKELIGSTEIHWIALTLGAVTQPILQVTRCDGDGKRTADGASWRYLKYNSEERRVLRAKGYTRAEPDEDMTRAWQVPLWLSLAAQLGL